MKLQTRWQKEIALVEGLPELAWTQKVPQRSTMLLSVGALLLVMAIVAGSVLLSLPRGTGGPIVLLALGIVGSLGIPMVLQSNLRDARKHRKHFENRQGHLVGVTYASEPWILGTRRAWDIGVLEVVNGTLTFEGYATHFMLPSASIESAELGRIDRFPQPEIRLIVNWQNELSSGRLNLVFLESNTTAEQRDVAEGIVHAVQSSESETFTDVVWPPIYQDDRLNLCLVER